MTKKTKVLLLIIILLALGLRVYRLDSTPPSISWDEAAVGYNAWTVANYGKDDMENFSHCILGHLGKAKILLIYI